MIQQQTSNNHLNANGVYGVLPIVREIPDTAKHKELCQRGCKWLKKHPQNVSVPNCSIVAVELFTDSNMLSWRELRTDFDTKNK
jgi:hypothetical protein